MVGNPVLREMEASAEQPKSIHLDSAMPLRILVVGGSRGAQALNEIVPEAIASLNEKVIVHHQTGKSNAAVVRDRYSKASNADVVVSEFIGDMAQAYQECDIVICRSGAMTVTELAALAVPSILVPFPFAVDDHQTLNARHLSEACLLYTSPSPRDRG